MTPNAISSSPLALISVSDKTGLIDFARKLTAYGFALLSTGGTARALRDAGLGVEDVAEFTGFPEMLDGRVKTLHPKIHAGLLARRDDPDHQRQMERHGLRAIDLLVVNLYPFEATAARPGASFEELIENIDIGGPTLVRAAAKNFTGVGVITSPSDYEEVARELESTRQLSLATRWELARRSFDRIAAYDAAIAATLARVQLQGEVWHYTPAGREGEFPESLALRYRKLSSLRYGENPHQRAALYGDPQDPSGLVWGRCLQGKELSYNNWVDLDACWALAGEFEAPAAAIIKHTNPAGCATADTLEEAWRRALACDPVSAFGSVVGINRKLDADTAREISKLFVECIAAPGYDAEALHILSAKKQLRLVEVPAPAPSRPATAAWRLKTVPGGVLAQDDDRASLDPAQLKVVTKRAPTAEEMASLEFGWKVAKHVKSNAIVLTRGTQTVGVGAGQMSRVDSVRLAVMKAQSPVQGTVLASDAFFPFPDGVEEAARNGVTAVMQPGGSVRDAEVIAACDQHGLAMVFTGFRHFRH